MNFNLHDVLLWQPLYIHLRSDILSATSVEWLDSTPAKSKVFDNNKCYTQLPCTLHDSRYSHCIQANICMVITTSYSSNNVTILLFVCMFIPYVMKPKVHHLDCQHILNRGVLSDSREAWAYEKLFTEPSSRQIQQ